MHLVWVVAERAQQRVIETGLASKVVGLLQEHKQDTATARIACRCLWNVSCNNCALRWCW